MKCRIYEYLRNNRGIGHTAAAAIGVKNSEAILVVSTKAEARTINEEHGVDCVTLEDLQHLPRSRPIICDNGAIYDEFKQLLALVNEKSELLMEISSNRPEVLREAMEAVNRRKK